MAEIYIDIDKYISKEEDMALEKYEVDEEIEIGLVPYKEISYKYDSGYGAYACEQIMEKDEMPETFKISGNFLNQLNVGQTYMAKGTVRIYNNKKQLKVEKIKKIQPKTIRTIKLFLKSLSGMGPFADIIYEEYGEDALDMIRNKPLELKNVCPGIYESLALEWQKELLEIVDLEEYLSKLISFGLKPIQAKNFFDIHKELSIEKIKENPYRLTRELKGFGFLKCDTIAKNIGYSLNSDKRIAEGLVYVLNNTKYDGNTYMLEKELLEKTSDLLAIKISIREMKNLYSKDKTAKKVIYKVGNLTFNIDMLDIEQHIKKYERAYYKKDKEEAKLIVFNIDIEDIRHQIEILRLSGRIIIDNKNGNIKIYDKYLYLCEDDIARKLINIEEKSNIIEDINVKKILDKYLEQEKIILEDKQYESVLNSSYRMGGFSIIDGSAGCGKTFTLKIALKVIEIVYEHKYGFFEPIILAPTGRASRVAAKATGMETATIHKILEYDSSGNYFFNAQNNLPYNCIVVDETSMLDVEIAKSLFDAVSSKTKVILMGDTKQLASVGPGNVLRDIIDSKAFKITTLNVAKRQSENSGVYKNAVRIVKKQMIQSEKETKDAYLFHSKDNSKILDKVISLYSSLDKQLNDKDFQVLVPQKGGMLGTNYLNFLLQEKFNPENNEMRILNKKISIVNAFQKNESYELYFKKGDKVLNMKNNYDLPWYELEDGKLIESNKGLGVSNGETGKIVKIIQNKDENKNKITKIIVKFDEKYIIYDNDFKDLDHSFAMTIHKSQGSEWQAVIMPITFSSYRMLENNLIYTGYTRARKWIAIVGDKEAVKYAIETSKSNNRRTGLKDRIKEKQNLIKE